MLTALRVNFALLMAWAVFTGITGLYQFVTTPNDQRPRPAPAVAPEHPAGWSGASQSSLPAPFAK